MCFSAVPGEAIPDDETEGNTLVFSLLRRLDENGNATKSELERPIRGRSALLSDCCAWTAAAACFSNEEAESDL